MITKIKEIGLDPQLSLQSAKMLWKVADGKCRFPVGPAPQKQKP